MSMTLTMVALSVAVTGTCSISSIRTFLKFRQQEKMLGRETARRIETNFTDESLLIKTLKEHGMEVTLEEDGAVRASAEEKELIYTKNPQGVYEVDLGGQPESEELVQELILLEEEYGFNVQEFTYQRLKEHLSSEGMEVHSEEVLEDNTIKIVLNV